MTSINDLMDLTLREVLEKYSVLENLECGYVYGVCSDELIEKMYKTYNIEEEYNEAMCADGLISNEIMDTDELITWDRIVRIMDNLGISKK